MSSASANNSLTMREVVLDYFIVIREDVDYVPPLMHEVLAHYEDGDDVDLSVPNANTNLSVRGKAGA
jgi:hypothetical protein